MLGAAKLLSSLKNKLNGNVRFIFQPAEEISGGALNMIKGGALKNPKPDFILGVHICPWLKSGTIGLKYGEMMAAVDIIKIRIAGEIAHGAYPHIGKDALIAAAAFINSVQSIISREIDPVDCAVVTFGKIHGGEAYNILCSEVNLEGTVRTLNEMTRQFIKTSILNKLKAVEASCGVKCSIDYRSIGNPLINAKEIVKICHDIAKEFYGEKNTILLDKPSMGGEDFADYLKEIPGNFLYIGSMKDKSTSYPWHHNNFNIDENVLPPAAKYIAYVVEKSLK
jgi:amidohydrolase